MLLAKINFKIDFCRLKIQFVELDFSKFKYRSTGPSAVDSGGAGDVRTPTEFGGSEKGQSLISAYRSLAITASTSGFEKLSMALSLFCNRPIKQRNKKE